MTDPAPRPGRGPLSWENALFGPVPTGRDVASNFNRFKRVTTGRSLTGKYWARRGEVVAALPDTYGPAEHHGLAMQMFENFYGICAAQGCQYLSTNRDTEAEALRDARRHAARARRGQP